MRLIVFAVYLGIGAMLHALFVGPTFDWASAWTFGWLFGWPIMVVAASWGFVIGLALAICAGFVLWAWLKMIAEWRARRRKSNRART